MTDPNVFNAMMITEENLEEVRDLVGFRNIPEVWIHRGFMILWTQTETPTSWTLPFRFFRDRYNIIEHKDNRVLVERIVDI
jgi:hypothetical protein